jgi:hypothetical protein
MPVIPALRIWMQEHPKFKASLSCNSEILSQNTTNSGCWWLMPVTLATWEAETRRIAVRGQPGQTVCKSLSEKDPTQEKAGRMTQVVERVPLPSRREVLSSNSSTSQNKTATSQPFQQTKALVSTACLFSSLIAYAFVVTAKSP